MYRFISHHKLHWTDQEFIFSVLQGTVLFIVSIIISTVANNYATLTGKNAVSDIILSNIRVFDVDFIVNYGPLFIIILILIILILRPSAIPFTMKSLALFIIIRAIFISATHLGQFTPQLALPSNGFFYFIGGGNTGGLFFSGHTGVPFLLALVFWHDKWLRALFIALSFILGTAMLLAHLHYTIDILGAFFITPTIFYLAKKFFSRDFELLPKNWFSEPV